MCSTTESIVGIDEPSIYYDCQQSMKAASEGAEMASGHASCHRQLDEP